LRELLQRSILFVGGKGGVGKTTTAASLAMMAAESGKECLVVSTDPAHSLSDIFETKIGDNVKSLSPKLSGLEIDPDAEADRYIAKVKSNMRELVHPEMFSVVDRQMNLARQAPGSLEAALLERMANLLAETRQQYDLLIFDTAPTGHTMQLLALPEAMAAWTDGMLKRHEKSRHLGKLLDTLGGKKNKESAPYSVGDKTSLELRRDAKINEILTARRQKYLDARELLMDQDLTAFILVLTPEKLPILETQKALELLQRYTMSVAAIVVNRLLPDDADGSFIETRRRQEFEYRREIERLFKAIPQYHLPLLPHDVHGPEALTQIGKMLVEAQ
jgi:arsenite-transporting ATPase